MLQVKGSHRRRQPVDAVTKDRGVRPAHLRANPLLVKWLANSHHIHLILSGLLSQRNERGKGNIRNLDCQSGTAHLKGSKVRSLGPY